MFVVWYEYIAPRWHLAEFLVYTVPIDMDVLLQRLYTLGRTSLNLPFRLHDVKSWYSRDPTILLVSQSTTHTPSICHRRCQQRGIDSLLLGCTEGTPSLADALAAESGQRYCELAGAAQRTRRLVNSLPTGNASDLDFRTHRRTLSSVS